ncbi:Probable tyrosyl-DNA phosphodiesterase [Anthophora quadrimaculata]
MATSFYTNNVSVKKPCPYMERCYRKNPIHFNEMSHPHLEKIVRNQLEGEIQIPEVLDFECTDRSLLVDQLKVLQMVLRKEKNNSGTSISGSLLSYNICSTSSTFTNESTKLNQNLKDIVERHKQGTSQRREIKLKEMDKAAEELFKSKEKGIIDNSNVSKMKEDLDNLKIAEESIEKSNCSKDRKRNNSAFGDSEKGKKKSKSCYSKFDEEAQEYTESIPTSSESVRSSSSLKGGSLIEQFQSCNSTISRSEVREKAIKMMKKQGFDVSVVEPGNFAMKYALSAPYHLFFTRVQKSKPTYDQQFTITFPEILDISLGEIVSSLQINFMVDVGWLCLQYLLAGQRTDMLILYGERVDEEKLSLNITMLPINMPTKFGCHHTKIMILKYKDDGIRVVVSTANLYSDDWENRTQGSVV